MASLANVNVRFGVDLKNFRSGMQKATRTMKNFGNQLKTAGRQMSTYLTAPLAGLAAVSLKAFDTQAKAENQLAAAISAAGRDVRRELPAFKQFASEIQSITTIGDESTLTLLSIASQMGLTADQAMVAAREAIALSRAMGMNEQSAIRYTAALAQGDSTMLNRYIPTLKQIEDPALRAAKAHELLGNMFGAATAEAQSGLGPWKQIQNQFGDLLEEFGAIISEALIPLAHGVKGVVTWFQGLSEETKRVIVVVSGLAASIGPLLATMGFLVGTILPAMAAGFAALTGPIGITIAAIGALAAAFLYVRDNWAAIKERISDWNWWRNVLISMLQFFVRYNIWGAMIKGAQELLNFFGVEFTIPDPFADMVEGLEKLKVETKQYENEFGSFGRAIKNGVKDGINALKGLSNQVTKNKVELSTPGPGSVPGPAAGGGGPGGGGSGTVNLIPDSMFGETSTGTLDEMTEKMGVFNGLVDGVSNGFANMFETLLSGGTNAFMSIGEAIKGFIKQLIAAVAKAAVLAGIMAILSGGGTGFLGALKSVIGVGGGGGGFAGFRATGGPVRSGKSYIVGENGPELFSADQNGTIFPNGSFGGGGSVRVEVSGVNRGRDLLLTQDFASMTRKRIRGY
jgi:hypothetical protein